MDYPAIIRPKRGPTVTKDCGGLLVHGSYGDDGVFYYHDFEPHALTPSQRVQFLLCLKVPEDWRIETTYRVHTDDHGLLPDGFHVIE